MAKVRAPYKKYTVEITLGIIEVSAKPLVVILSFLYGKGKIKMMTFILSVGAVQFIGAIFFIKSNIYDRRKISNKIEVILNKVTKNEASDKQSSALKLYGYFCVMLLLQLIFINVSSISLPLYKMDKIGLIPCAIVFLLSFIVGSVPIILFRRRECIKKKENCHKILNNLNETKQWKYHHEIFYACIETTCKATVVMLHFLYGADKINHIVFIAITASLQFLVSIVFVKNVIYDTKTINSQLHEIFNKVKKNNGSEDTVNDHSSKTIKCNNLTTTILMIVLQNICTVGIITAPFFYKQEKLSFISYIAISSLSFIIGIVPTVVCRRMQKVEDNFISEQIITELVPKEQLAK